MNINKEKIIEAALKHKCQAIHPGYGFLSENSQFAGMAAAAGLVFIGPPARVIGELGDKIASKALARKAGVPVVPGHNQPVADPDEVLAIAEEIGYGDPTAACAAAPPKNRSRKS